MKLLDEKERKNNNDLGYKATKREELKEFIKNGSKLGIEKEFKNNLVFRPTRKELLDEFNENAKNQSVENK